MDENKVVTKKDLKLKAQEMKLEEKQRKMEEKVAIREEKERIKNSFSRKFRNFILGIVFVIILLLVGFIYSQKFLTQKEKQLYDEKMNQIYKTAVISIKNKDYKNAIDLLETIDENYSKYSEVKNKQKEVYQLYLNEYLTESDSYLKDKKFDKALKVLNEIEEDYKDEQIVLDKKSEIFIEKIKSEVEKLEESQDTLKILEYISEIDSNGFEDVDDQIEKIENKYKDSFILEARELIKKDLSKAETQINKASKLLPKDKDIQKLVDELEEAKKLKKEAEEKEAKEKETEEKETKEKEKSDEKSSKSKQLNKEETSKNAINTGNKTSIL